MKWTTRLLVLLLALLAAPLSQAHAQAASRAQLDAAYARVMENPADRELTLQYAAIAMQMKDYEAAIPPLERLLMREPDNAKLKLQIGILYHALGSKLMAKQYFQDAMGTPGVDANIVEEAKGYLHDM